MLKKFIVYNNNGKWNKYLLSGVNKNMFFF